MTATCLSLLLLGLSSAFADEGEFAAEIADDAAHKQDAAAIQPGGKAQGGTGIQGDKNSRLPPATPKETSDAAGGVLSMLDPCAPVPCYDPMPKNPKHVGKGRLYCVTMTLHCGMKGGKDKKGEPLPKQRKKNVHTYQDGSHPEGSYYVNLQNAFPAAAQKFADETGDKRILDQRITGYRTRVKSFYTVGGGAFMDNHEPAPVIDVVEWEVSISGGYKWTFTDNAHADCVRPGAFLTGPSGASVFTEPQHAAMYKGRYICFRCKETDNPYPPLRGAR